MATVASPEQRARTGVAYALGAYLIWGFLPLYFRLLSTVFPVEIVAQRVLWSILFVLVLAAASGRLARLAAGLRDRRVLLLLTGSATLIAVNWLVYVWAVLNSHVLATSLGYYLNPLVNVAMGVVLLKERLSRAQGVAVGLAAAGVLVLAVGAPAGLWISLTLAFSFGSYGLIRKLAPVEALEGLAIETLILAPFALGAVWVLAGRGDLAFGAEAGQSLLLALGGIVTALPLLLFAAGARRLRYATVGILQFVAPTIQFGLAVLVFGEPLTVPHMICFAGIWTGLFLYAADSLRQARGLKSSPVTGEDSDV